MANVDKAFGLRPLRHINGAPWNGATIQCVSTDSTLIGIGDAVDITGTADDDGVIAVTRASVGNPIFGVVVGVEAQTESSLVYKAASTTRYLSVCVDKDVVYAIQSAGTVAKTDIGLCADLDTIANANTATGISTMELSGTMASGTAQLKIVGIVRSPDNVLGANVDVEVVINESRLGNGIDGV
jgi:hypothetical protein